MQKWFQPKSRMWAQKVATAEIADGTAQIAWSQSACTWPKVVFCHEKKRLHAVKSRFYAKKWIAFRMWLSWKAQWAAREQLRPMARLGFLKWPLPWGQLAPKKCCCPRLRFALKGQSVIAWSTWSAANITFVSCTTKALNLAKMFFFCFESGKPQESDFCRNWLQPRGSA